MSTIAGDLVTTTASTATSINYAGQSQLVADGKLDVPVSGQTGDYHLEDRSRYRIQDTESIQSLWANDAWTEIGHNFTVDYEAHDVWVYNQTINLPKNSDPIITDNGDGTFTSSVVQLGQDQAAITSAGGYDYHLTQSGSPKDFLFSLNHTSQSQSAKYDTGTWRAADGTSGANYDNLGNETKNSRADLAGRVQNGSVYYAGIDVYQTKNTSTNNAGSGFALGSTTNSHTVGATQTIESRGGNSGSWYGSKLESGNSTTNYTTVSGTMGQPFSGMTQAGFNLTTLYGTAAQTGITGMYGYGQTGTGTSTPFTYVLADGEPDVSTPGGRYSGSQSGVVSGFVTPVANFLKSEPTTFVEFQDNNEDPKEKAIEEALKNKFKWDDIWGGDYGDKFNLVNKNWRESIESDIKKCYDNLGVFKDHLGLSGFRTVPMNNWRDVPSRLNTSSRVGFVFIDPNPGNVSGILTQKVKITILDGKSVKELVSYEHWLVEYGHFKIQNDYKIPPLDKSKLSKGRGFDNFRIDLNKPPFVNGKNNYQIINDTGKFNVEGQFKFFRCSPDDPAFKDIKRKLEIVEANNWGINVGQGVIFTTKEMPFWWECIDNHIKHSNKIEWFTIEGKRFIFKCIIEN